MARRIEDDLLTGTALSLYYDAGLREYEVRVNGQKDGDENYFTGDKADALSTAKMMLEEIETANQLKGN